MADPKFQFYEKVRIVSSDPQLAEINGAVGAILGRAEDEDGRFDYGVYIYRDEICWNVAEGDLAATGEHDRRDTFYDGTSVRVRVDEQGRGWIVD